MRDAGPHLEVLFFQEQPAFDFRRGNRPYPADTQVVFCIPAAFTCRNAGGPWQTCGLTVDDGTKTPFAPSDAGNCVEGMVQILNGRMRVFPCGAVNRDSLIAETQQQQGDYYEQLLLVNEGKPILTGEVLANTTPFVGRVLAYFNPGGWAIVQATRAMTRREFSERLAALGASQATYTDMGSWSAGWYRTSKGEVVPIGWGNPDKQTNWLVLK